MRIVFLSVISLEKDLYLSIIPSVLLHDFHSYHSIFKFRQMIGIHKQKNNLVWAKLRKKLYIFRLVNRILNTSGFP